MSLDDPVTLFAVKMALCLALFLLGAAWLRRAIERARRTKGLPPPGASPLATVQHLFGDRGPEPPVDHQRRLYRQTIRILATELRRLDPDHAEAREALALLELDREVRRAGLAEVPGSEAVPPAAGQRVRTEDPQQAFH